MKNQKICNLRVCAILLVVIGHSIILYSPAWTYYESERSCQFFVLLLSIIDLIQMPLYFSISGYLFWYTKRNNNRTFIEFIKDKTKRLLVPFVICGLLWMLPIKKMIHYAGYENVKVTQIIVKKIFWGGDNGHLWFLEALFVVFLIMYFFSYNDCKAYNEQGKKYLKHISKWILLIIMSLYAYKLNRIPVLKNATQYMIWFYTGFLIHAYEEGITKYKKIFSIVGGLLSFVGIGLYLANCNGILRYIVSLIIVVTLYSVMPQKSSRLIQRLERDSYGIYLFHSPLIYITCTYLLNESPLLVFGVNFFVWGTLAVIMTELLRKTKLRFVIGE